VHVGRWRAHACQLVVMENDRQWEGPLTQQVIDKHEKGKVCLGQCYRDLLVMLMWQVGLEGQRCCSE